MVTPMKIMIVLNFEVPDAEAVPGILTAIDPPHLAHFAGVAHVVVEPHVAELESWLSATDPDPLDPALARLEALVRDFDHYANHGDPNHGADTFFRTLHGHLVSTFLLAGGRMPLSAVVDELESHDREIARYAIEAGFTSAVGSRRPGSAFGL